MGPGGMEGVSMGRDNWNRHLGAAVENKLQRNFRTRESPYCNP